VNKGRWRREREETTDRIHQSILGRRGRREPVTVGGGRIQRWVKICEGRRDPSVGGVDTRVELSGTR